MNLIDRVKNILITPQKEWDVINGETPNTSAIITGYVLPLAGAAAVAAFIGYAFIGVNFGFGIRLKGMDWGLYQGISVLLGALLSILICSFIIDALAPSFGSEKNMGRSVQLVAYAFTPGWVGGLLAVIPALAIVGGLAGLYGLYLLYIGLPKLKKTPQDKQVSYFVVSLVTIIVVYIVIGFIVAKILISIFGLEYPTAGLNIRL
jgi:Yip1 domain